MDSDNDRPNLRDEILADLADIAIQDPRWALAKAFEYGYSAGRVAGVEAAMDRLFPVKEAPCGS